MSRMDAPHAYRGWDIFTMGNTVAAHFINAWPENAMKLVSKSPVPQGQWTHVFVTYDGTAKPEGVHIYVNGGKSETEVEGTPNLTGTMRTEVSTKLGRRTGADTYFGQVDDAQIYNRELGADEVKALASVPPAAPLMIVPPEKRTDEQKKLVTRYWLLD